MHNQKTPEQKICKKQSHYFLARIYLKATGTKGKLNIDF